jgi:hypothetical protein
VIANHPYKKLVEDTRERKIINKRFSSRAQKKCRKLTSTINELI